MIDPVIVKAATNAVVAIEASASSSSCRFAARPRRPIKTVPDAPSEAVRGHAHGKRRQPATAPITTIAIPRMGKNASASRPSSIVIDLRYTHVARPAKIAAPTPAPAGLIHVIVRSRAQRARAKLPTAPRARLVVIQRTNGCRASNARHRRRHQSAHQLNRP